MVNIQDGVLNSSNHFNSVLVRISEDKIQDGSGHYGGFSNGQASIIYLRSRPFSNHRFKHSKPSMSRNQIPTVWTSLYYTGLNNVVPNLNGSSNLQNVRYSGDLKTRNIWIPKLLKFKFQTVQYSDGRPLGYILWTRPTIQILDQYIRKKGWRLCAWYSNGWVVWYSNGIENQKPDHLAFDRFSIIPLIKRNLKD